MKNKYSLFLICILISNFQLFFAQTTSIVASTLTCGTPIPDSDWENQISDLVKKAKANLNANKSQSLPYTIPVIIHVIHGGQAIGTYPNLANGQIVSQIQTLNNDFGGIGFNSSLYPVSAFTNYALSQSISVNSLDALNRIKIANCNIQFCLATKDTLGNNLSEPGIDRINYITKGWSNPASFGNSSTFQTYMNGTVKPQSIWNVSKYLNIWVSDINIGSSGLLGYATFPILSTLAGLSFTVPSYFGTNTTDGFWSYAKAFGSSQIFPSGTYYQNYTLGRTSTHEIGHWLGMRHIWGDANCGSDFCDDTPPAKASNFGSLFTYPYHSGTCNGNSPNGEMMMNFMDYTNDNAKYMFTTDQSIRMQTVMQNSPYRKFLGSHNLCSVAEIAAVSNFNIPATICQGNALTLSNQSQGTPVPNYTWSANGNPIFFPNNNNALKVSFPNPGIYTITLSAFNGSLSTISKTVTVKPAPILTITPARSNYCLGENLTLVADGGDEYYWQPDSILQSYVFVPTNTIGSFNYSCYATSSNSCKSNTAINFNVIDCTGLLENEVKNNSNFIVFPNPSTNNIIIESIGILKENTKIEVVDALGKILMLKIMQKDETKNKVDLNITELNKGLYILKIIRANQLLYSKILLKE